MNREPVMIIELIKVAMQSGLAWVIAMGWWKIDDMQAALTLAFFMAVINLGGALIQRNFVTPLGKANDR